MRIFQSFLLLVVVALLWMIPISEGIYNFRTDIREDTFTVTTGVGETEADLVLFKPVYNEDENTIVVYSSNSSDTPVMNTYDPDTREVNVTGLIAEDSRTITIQYLIDALVGNTALDIFLDMIPWIWILVLFSFPLLSLWVIWTGRL